MKILIYRLECEIEEIRQRLIVDQGVVDCEHYKSLNELYLLMKKLDKGISKNNSKTLSAQPKIKYFHGRVLSFSYVCEGYGQNSCDSYDIYSSYEGEFDGYPHYVYKVRFENSHNIDPRDEIVGFIITIEDIITTKNHTFEFNKMCDFPYKESKRIFRLGNIVTVSVREVVGDYVRSDRQDQSLDSNIISVPSRIQETTIIHISYLLFNAGCEYKKIFEICNRIRVQRIQALILKIDDKSIF